MPFEVESIQSPRDCPPDYEGIYSQAYFLYKSGFRYWFSREEVVEQNRHNSEFETPRLEYKPDGHGVRRVCRVRRVVSINLYI